MNTKTVLMTMVLTSALMGCPSEEEPARDAGSDAGPGVDGGEALDLSGAWEMTLRFEHRTLTLGDGGMAREVQDVTVTVPNVDIVRAGTANEWNIRVPLDGGANCCSNGPTLRTEGGLVTLPAQTFSAAPDLELFLNMSGMEPVPYRTTYHQLINFSHATSAPVDGGIIRFPSTFGMTQESYGAPATQLEYPLVYGLYVELRKPN